MEAANFTPRVHFFVCTNVREGGDPLGSGCGKRGEAVFARLKARVATEGTTRSVWVTRAGCLGICPRAGATVAVYPAQRILTEVEAMDGDRLYDASTPKNLDAP